MATISLSPTPASISAMSARRGPLTNNPNVANSPLRGASTLAAYAKQKRSYATIQREEPYGQPPPSKKQVLDPATQRAVRSPTKSSRNQVLVQRVVSRPVARERPVRASQTSRAAQDVDTEKETWKRHHRAKFPKMVFYFESIPDDTRARLTKRVTYLGARQEPFFSIAVTHVVTTRSIPPERTEAGEETEDQHHQQQEPEEQPQTINPSLLDRNTEARRKLLFEFRNAPSRQQLDDPLKRMKGSRNNDVLYKAREMGKKIWSLEKFQNMLNVLLESETGHSTSYGSRSASSRHYGTSRGTHEGELHMLLQRERLNGPSDRDPSSHRELNYFKGPHIYVWDMDEKQKPIMVREYAKVANKSDGEWPQFRSVGNGRCPFVEEVDIPTKEQRRQREQEKARAAAKREDAVPILKPPQIPVPKPVTGKRSLTEMEDGHTNRIRAVTPTELFNPAKVVMMKQPDGQQQNAFMSRAGTGRLLAGEPVASGVQPSNITSAIRSQMISSTSGVAGAKAGTSKEVHGLQRKVLQKAAPASHDISSRRLAEVSMEVASSRSTTLGRLTSRPAEMHEDESQKTAEKKAHTQTLKSKRDLKPGYCENCQDKFRDFDEHILSRKHRKFAENNDNWVDLDSLLKELKRAPKCSTLPSDADEGW